MLGLLPLETLLGALLAELLQPLLAPRQFIMD